MLPLIISSLLLPIFSLVCPRASYQFTSHYSLGKGDELNRTFTRIQQELPTLNWTHTFHDTNITYTIQNFTAIFKYIDSSQKSEAVGNDTIMVYDGFLRLQFSFNWTKTGTQNISGLAQGVGRTDEIAFAKNIIINSQGMPMFNLYGYYPVIWGVHGLNITRLQPYTQSDAKSLNQILNSLDDEGQTLRSHWISGINNILPFHLNNSLHDQYHKLQRYINYTYIHPTKGNQTVTFQHFLVGIDLQVDGLNMNFSMVIKDYANFDCGKQVPNIHRPTKEYGGIQEFVSLGVYKSTVAYGLEKGFFDTTLNAQSWQSLHFQFYVGDLYDVIPQLKSKYYPNQKLVGSCKALINEYDLIRGGTDSLNVSMTFNCSLYANATDKITDIQIKSFFHIQGHPVSNYIDFIILDVTFTAQYTPGTGYSIQNIDLANYYFQSTASSLRGSKVFGSRFPTQTRDYPHFQVNTDYVFMYDSASIHRQNAIGTQIDS